MSYIIRNKKDRDLFWSNKLGWVDILSSDVFTDREYRVLYLPIEGEWVKLPKQKEN